MQGTVEYTLENKTILYHETSRCTEKVKPVAMNGASTEHTLKVAPKSHTQLSTELLYSHTKVHRSVEPHVISTVLCYSKCYSTVKTNICSSTPTFGIYG